MNKSKSQLGPVILLLTIFVHSGLVLWGLLRSETPTVTTGHEVLYFSNGISVYSTRAFPCSTAEGCFSCRD